MGKKSNSFFASLLGRSKNKNETVSMNYIDKICNQGCEFQLLFDLIVQIGHESLDPSKEYIGGGMFTSNGIIPKKVVWPPKEGVDPFHVFDPITKEWIPDPRILKIGMALYNTGGSDLIRRTFYEVNKKYHGSLRLLEFAWKDISEW